MKFKGALFFSSVFLKNMPCALCGAKDAAKRCSNCKSLSYCSADCQAVHWKSSHKRECSNLRDELKRALGEGNLESRWGRKKAEQKRGFLLRGRGEEEVGDPAAGVSPPDVSGYTQELIHNSSDGALRVQTSSSEGRHVVTCNRVSAGSVVMTSECYATVVSEAMLTDACSRCMARLPEGGARCKGCGTHFCNASCLDDAGPEHAAECSAIAGLKLVHQHLSSDIESVRLLLRILARRAVEASAEDGLVHWRDIETLLSNSEAVRKQTPTSVSTITADAKLLFSLLPPPVATGLSDQDLLLLLLRIKYNSHPVYDTTGSTRIGMCVCVCMYVRLCMYVCMYVCIYMQTYIHTYMYIRMYIRIYVHTHMHTYIHTYIYTYIHTHHTYIHTRLR
jgi:hypothetical protein